jgi:3-dehydroquinate synthase
LSGIMHNLNVGLGQNSYKINICQGGLKKLGVQISRLISTNKCCLVTQRQVFKHHGLKAYASLRRQGYRVHLYLLPDGEKAKSLKESAKLYRYLMDNEFDRGSFLIALGGGVVGDLTGFVASTYMRGLPYVQLPTTLLSAVDSSIGGKTGVNFNGVKNIVGSFYQPKLVLIDLDTIRTLSTQEFKAGLAEVIKYAILSGDEFFALLENEIDKIEQEPLLLQQIVATCCEIKKQIVERDEKEKLKERMLLNLGHTMGHAIEISTNWRHGEAVAAGTVFASKYANKLGYLNNQDLAKIISLIKKTTLPWEIPKNLEMNTLKKLIYNDKKRTTEKINWVLPHKIGDVRVHPISLSKMPNIL